MAEDEEIDEDEAFGAEDERTFGDVLPKMWRSAARRKAVGGADEDSDDEGEEFDPNVDPEEDAGEDDEDEDSDGNVAVSAVDLLDAALMKRGALAASDSEQTLRLRPEARAIADAMNRRDAAERKATRGGSSSSDGSEEEEEEESIGDSDSESDAASSAESDSDGDGAMLAAADGATRVHGIAADSSARALRAAIASRDRSAATTELLKGFGATAAALGMRADGRRAGARSRGDGGDDGEDEDEDGNEDSGGRGMKMKNARLPVIARTEAKSESEFGASREAGATRSNAGARSSEYSGSDGDSDSGAGSGAGPADQAAGGKVTLAGLVSALDDSGDSDSDSENDSNGDSSQNEDEDEDMAEGIEDEGRGGDSESGSKSKAAKAKAKARASRQAGRHGAAREAASALMRGAALVAPGSSAVLARAARSEQYDRTSSAVSRW